MGGRHGIDSARATVERLTSCSLSLTDRRWAFAEENRAAIDALWRAERERNPRFFNGAVHLVCERSITSGGLRAKLLRTDFKSCLYWRKLGFPPAGVIDAFGSALVTSKEGAIILGRQRAGNLNAGLTYLPAGFIDADDIGPSGEIDIAGSVMREIGEETGLGAADIERRQGFYAVCAGAQLSIAVPFASPLDARDLVARIEDHIAAAPDSELETVVAVRSLSDLDGLALPHYTRPLLERLLARA